MMSTEPIFYLAMGLTTLATTLVLAIAGLRGWHAWIALKRSELEALRLPGPQGDTPNGAMARIELADLKERVRKLEAIAAGVDL